MSIPMSASLSPGPSTSTHLELYNQHEVAKPFKRVHLYSNSSTGRRRNYKQIIAAEQEAQFELGGGISSKRKYKKKKPTGANAGGIGSGAVDGTPPQLSADGTKQLMGAAAKAARKREERLKRENAAKEAARSGEVSAEGTPAPDTDGAAVASVDDGTDADATMKIDAGEPAPTEEQLRQQKAEEQERIRKMHLPTCENHRLLVICTPAPPSPDHS